MMQVVWMVLGVALCFTGGLGVGLVLGRANGYKEASRVRRRYYGLGEEGAERDFT